MSQPQGRTARWSPLSFGPSAGLESNGLLATGTITAAHLVGPLAGHPLRDLLTAIQAGTASANAHTIQCPGGEVRGQVRPGD
jgi:hypothetical protein